VQVAFRAGARGDALRDDHVEPVGCANSVPADELADLQVKLNLRTSHPWAKRSSGVLPFMSTLSGVARSGQARRSEDHREDPDGPGAGLRLSRHWLHLGGAGIPQRSGPHPSRTSGLGGETSTGPLFTKADWPHQRRSLGTLPSRLATYQGRL
jgi:hypothetical protein